MASFHEDMIWFDPAAYEASCTTDERDQRGADVAPGASRPDDGLDRAFDGDHNVEYWFWNGSRLVPASPDEAERYRQREAWERLVAREAREQQLARRRQLWRLGLRAFLSFVALRSRLRGSRASSPAMMHTPAEPSDRADAVARQRPLEG